MTNGPYDSSGHPPKAILDNRGPYDSQVVSSSPREDGEDGPHDTDDGCSSTGGIG